MLTPEKPPIASHRCWPNLEFNLQPKSKNQRRLPLRGGITPAGVQVPCVCGVLFDPFRDGSMFVTAPGHTSCSVSQQARNWAAWVKIEIGKLHTSNVQYGLYE